MNQIEINEVPIERLQFAVDTIQAAWRAANDELQAFNATIKKRHRPTKAEAARQGYLAGRVTGLYAAMLEFEKIRPLRLVGSGADDAPALGQSWMPPQGGPPSADEAA